MGGLSVRRMGGPATITSGSGPKGKGHHASGTQRCFKWIRILFRCWRDRVPYSEQSYLEALRTHGAAKCRPTAIVSAHPRPSVHQWENCGGFSKLVETFLLTD